MGTGVEQRITVSLSSMTGEQAADKLEGLINSDAFQVAERLAPIAPQSGNLIVSSEPNHIHAEFVPASGKSTSV